MSQSTSTTRQTNTQNNHFISSTTNFSSPSQSTQHNMNKILVSSQSPSPSTTNYQSSYDSSSTVSGGNLNLNSSIGLNQHSVSAAPPLVNGHSIVVINEVLPVGQISKYQYSYTPQYVAVPSSVISLSTSNSNSNSQQNNIQKAPIAINQQGNNQSSTKTTTITTMTTHSLPQNSNINTQSSSFANNNIVIRPTPLVNQQPITIQPTITNSQQSINLNTNTPKPSQNIIIANSTKT